ncbi:MAG TPA: hypothetical protein VE913_12535, partial [Longimicrobium sp.]|nr:hypothetical protein [Longimicrobium sp.]
MAKKPSALRQRELDELNERCLVILRFLGETGHLDSRLDAYLAALSEAYSRGDRRALRAAADDLAGRIRRLSAAEREVIDGRLDAKISAEEDVRVRRIQEILQRGSIDNEMEHRLLFEYVEESAME